MSASAMKRLIQSRPKRERAQPSARAHLGLLEKHKDYVKRAKDGHAKEDALRLLREKAALKNPDEFYFGMIRARTVDGFHVDAGKEEDEKKVGKAKLEDANYLLLKKEQEQKRVDKLHAELHFAKKAKGTHTVFVEDEVDTFDPVEYFNTDPELVENCAYRVKRDALEHIAINSLDKESLTEILRQKKKAYKELDARQERLDKIKKEQSKVELERILMGKGKKRKIITEDGQEYFKWSSERKK